MAFKQTGGMRAKYRKILYNATVHSWAGAGDFSRAFTLFRLRVFRIVLFSWLRESFLMS
jgi:hypothetical protein